MNVLPRSKRDWLRLGSLPFKTYVLSAYWVFFFYRAEARWMYDTTWAFYTLLGYVVAFWALVAFGFAQRLNGFGDHAQVSWLAAVLAVLFIILLLPGLAK